ncbi:hypothetical protein PRIPAC_78304 [Pristionchus pacificus]|nr:hypothetical protein PRIPAC_78304 [Pristionchus pacificus]
MAPGKQFPNSRIVQTAQGKVQGRRLIYEGEKQVDAFQGIPFAAPPIGELRFKKPQPHPSWNGVRETKAFSARPIQAKKYPQDYDMNGVPSEDCLYLNVFSPCWEPPETGFPVMIFIPGGGFECGEAKTYGDDNICENIVTRDIVFITIQYRVGYLGFFTTGDSVCPGNLGLWDQTEALKWVQANIEAFGGNKNNVTVVGQSAGGASADFLHISPHSTGLFHKVICMAGTADCRWTSYDKMPLHCRNKARRLGITSDSSEEIIAELRKVPAEQLVVNITRREKEDDAFMETVVYNDEDFFPASFDELRARAKPKPMITGVTKEEGLLMMLSMKLNKKTALYFTTLASHSAKDNKLLEKDFSRRFDGLVEYSDQFGVTLANFVSDYFFNAGTLELCRKSVEIQKEPVYLYTFEHWNPEVMGFMVDMLPYKDVTHTCDLYYLFKIGTLGDFRPEISENEQRLIDEFTTAFTNFAKFGNPNGSNIVATELSSSWEPVTRENHSRNYVFKSENCAMNEQFFGGRTEEFIRIVNTHNANQPRSSL